MKKGTSISLMLLMIAAMLNISVATHYCGGTVAASKVSLTGILADCGMEDNEKDLPPSGTLFSKHCCEDIVTYCGTDSNYTPSFHSIPESYQYNFQTPYMPDGLSVNGGSNLIRFYTNVNPPGVLMSTSVDLTAICVFRI